MPYFDSRQAELYDGDAAFVRSSCGDVEFYAKLASEADGAVLELGCGTGRVLLPIAASGVDITGVDSSASMLDYARSRIDAVDSPGLRAELVEADMSTVDLGRRFALVFSAFRPIAHLHTLDSQLAFLENARRHLAPGGRFALDFFQPDPARLAVPRPEHLELERVSNGRTIRRYTSIVPRLSIQTLEIEFRWEIETGDGPMREERVDFQMRWYHRYELEHLLARAGLRIEALHGDFSGSPLEDSSAEMVFICSG